MPDFSVSEYILAAIAGLVGLPATIAQLGTAITTLKQSVRYFLRDIRTA